MIDTPAKLWHNAPLTGETPRLRRDSLATIVQI